METVISNNDRIAIAEVDYIIHHMNEKYLNMIPQKILDYITILKKKNIEISIDPQVPLENQGLKEFTLYFLMVLNLKYWCDDERRREILARMEFNQKQIDEKIINIFDQAESIRGDERTSNTSATGVPREIITANGPVAEQENAIAQMPKENFFVRFINKIKLRFQSKNV